MSQEKSIEGIGGWLILVAIGIVVTPIRIVTLILTTYPEIFTSGIWDAITSKGSEAYSPMWASIILGELLINSGLLVVWLYMAYKFFTKSRDFPKWYIGIAVCSLTSIVADAYAIKLVLPNEPVFDPDTVKELMRSSVMVFIWVPYMLLSKRVKATFVKSNLDKEAQPTNASVA
ncbi:DUF2569 domain-containing protein [Microbulbifer sp. SAOS-129_SWC]|uniref:DUF2569 domain-containing protein n=1 Tax=Microbulbifer sp. SAOS-129_SWC TaxID=3145235 RepID=UPI0032176192